MITKNKVLEVLTKEWQTTFQIANKLKIYHAAAIQFLYLLFSENKIERLQIGRNLCWRLK